jgi:hypothetical protein
MEQAFAVFTTFLIAALPLAVGVTKIVDTIRNLLDPSDKFPKVAWNLVAIVIGVAFCLGWGFDIFTPLVQAIPAFKDSSLTGSAGEILSGICVGAMAGFWHEKLDSWSAQAKALKKQTGTQVQVS